MDTMLVSILHDFFDKNPNSFPPHIKSKVDIAERYHSDRTWRRTSDTRAIEKGVDGKDIDAVKH